MKVITVDNVNDALVGGIDLLQRYGKPLDSRNGATLEIPCPVTTVYLKPWNRVLLSKLRDANPFFHLMEAMWILAGRDDVKFLTEFNKRMADYSDDGETFNAPYGYRLRTQFNDSGNCDLDQLAEVIGILKSDPNSRQAVCQIWDTTDLDKDTKDKACNMSIVFRIRDHQLCMTVYNRSNDMIWGAYGANVVQFSMIQEYVAAHLNLSMGEYTHVSNAFHVYLDGPGGELWDRLSDQLCSEETLYHAPYHSVGMLNYDIDNIDHDLKQFFKLYDEFGLEEIVETTYWKSDYFNQLILPMLCVHRIHKTRGASEALTYIDKIIADDWRKGCQDWLENRIK